VTDPFVEAARVTFAKSADALIEGVSGRSAEHLNWSPPWGGTNSMAVIATHAFGSARSWFACAMGAALPSRDRDAEFRTVVSSPEEFVAGLVAVRAECEASLAPDAPAIDWGELRPTHARQGATAADGETGSWAMIHALEHVREHVGQLWLTDELYRSSQG
jgi:DinB superfamily